MNQPCSGLGSFNACDRRASCANYCHWLDDPRSHFNRCTASGVPLKFYVPRDIPAVMAVAVAPGQASLF